MGVGLDELERTLSYSVFCDRCGYNLRRLPYVGQCPECGNAYNARPLKLKGIYHAFDLKFPLSDIIVAIGCVSLGVVMIYRSLDSPVGWRIISGSTLVLVGSLFTSTAYADATRYLRFRRIVRRAELDEEYD